MNTKLFKSINFSIHYNDTLFYFEYKSESLNAAAQYKQKANKYAGLLTNI